MIERDTIQHLISPSGIRLTAADISTAGQEAQRIHHLSPLYASILAKIMAGALILANDFKNREGISILWKTKTRLGNIHAEAYDGRYVRGCMDHSFPDDRPDTLENEQKLISNHGTLYVIRYSLLKTPYTSSVPLSSKSISGCFAEYLNQSDQTLSSVRMETSFRPDGELDRTAAYMAQFMPQGDMKKWKSYFKDKRYDVFSNDENNVQSLPWLIRNDQFTLLHKESVSYHCTCSEDKIKQSLIMLPEKDKESLLKDDHLEVHCQYCGKTYVIPREKLRQWFSEKRDNKNA